MKVKILVLALLAVALVIGGCNKIKELADVTFDADFDVDLDVNVPPGTLRAGSNGAFSTTTTIDPLADSTVEKYIDKIKGWEITSLTGKIVRVSKPGVTLQNAELQVYSENFNASWYLPVTPLTKNQIITLDNSDGQWDAVENILGEKKVFTVSAEGATDEDDFSFTIRVFVKSRVTANPL